MTIVNLNHKILFKPTVQALEVLAEDHNKHINLLSGWIKKKPSDFEKKINSDGFYEMQLHCFMKLFGEYMYNGSSIQIAKKNDIFIPSNGS